MEKRVDLGPAEKHMEKGQVKFTYTEVYDDKQSRSSSIYLPEGMLDMIGTMMHNYRVSKSKAFAVVLDVKEDRG